MTADDELEALAVWNDAGAALWSDADTPAQAEFHRQAAAFLRSLKGSDPHTQAQARAERDSGLDNSPPASGLTGPERAHEWEYHKGPPNTSSPPLGDGWQFYSQVDDGMWWRRSKAAGESVGGIAVPSADPDSSLSPVGTAPRLPAAWMHRWQSADGEEADFFFGPDRPDGEWVPLYQDAPPPPVELGLKPARQPLGTEAGTAREAPGSVVAGGGAASQGPSPNTPAELGLETTATDRIKLNDALAGKALALLRDFNRRGREIDRLSAEVARRTADERGWRDEISRLNAIIVRCSNGVLAREATARAEEREACATLGIVVPSTVNPRSSFMTGWHAMGDAYRAAIRARTP